MSNGSPATPRVTYFFCEIDMSEPEKIELNDEFTLTVDGEEREVVMKFALLRELARAFPGPSDPQSVFHDEHMFETALTILLVPRDEKTGKVILSENQEWSIDDIDLSPADAINLVKWAMEHVLGFFLQKFNQVMTLGETHAGQIEALLSSLPGLNDLASKRASAGPTDFNTLISEISTGESPIETSEPT